LIEFIRIAAEELEKGTEEQEEAAEEVEKAEEEQEVKEEIEEEKTEEWQKKLEETFADLGGIKMENKYSIKSFYIPEEYQETFKKLDGYCEAENVSKSFIICEAVKAFLEKIEETKNI